MDPPPLNVFDIFPYSEHVLENHLLGCLCNTLTLISYTFLKNICVSVCILYYFATPCSLEIYLTQKYLGDLISSSGNNTENVKERCKTGFKAISQIKALMKDVSMGKYTIQIGLIFRDTMFVSKMLLNSEVWHCLTQSQVQELEKLDRILIRHVFDAHSKTGLEWLYLDAGKLNLGSLIQIRRLMYLWHILSRDESELIRRVYETKSCKK